ncbi:MAG TPA: beta-propeller domain-containing protein, partial [Ignavibacteria bacterium]
MLKSNILITFICFTITANSFSNQVYLTLINDVTVSDEPTDILLYEDKAYILANGNLASFYTSDPYKINLTSYESITGVTSAAFTGRYAYVAGNFGGIKLYDITKHREPVLKNTISINGKIKKIVIDNGYLYVVNNDLGLQIYDVNTSDFPLYKN